MTTLTVLDLFAGTGAMGIEALSRGANGVVFVEPHSRARMLILKNLEKCRFAEARDTDSRFDIIQTSAQSAINSLAESGRRFDLIYADPPFMDDLYSDILLGLSASTLLNEGAQVTVEHNRKTKLVNSYGRLSLIKSRRLGDTCLSLFS